jgi:hypothetical protein
MSWYAIDASTGGLTPLGATAGTFSSALDLVLTDRIE